MVGRIVTTLLCVSFLVLSSATASAQSSSISGVVTESGTGEPIPMAEVGAINMDSMTTAETFTDSTGYYLIEGLSSGYHIVGAHKEGYEDGGYPDLIIVGEGEHVPDIDFTLTFVGGTGFGSISGRITEAGTGNPVADAGIDVSGVVGIWHTDSEGYYFCDSIPDGTYSVTAYKLGYYVEIYPDSVVVAIDENTPDVDFVLTPFGEPGGISGTVVDLVTQEPIPQVHVSASGRYSTGYDWTDDNGEYTITDLVGGNYFVSAWSETHWEEDYPESVLVISGETTMDIDFVLTPHGGPDDGVIAGSIFDENTQEPLDLCLVVAVTDDDNFGGAFTNPDGSYFIYGLPIDEYYVFALRDGYSGEFYDGVYTWEEATPVIPDAYDIDLYLAPCDSGEGMISGIVTSGGLPAEDALVRAETNGDVSSTASTSGDGSFTLMGLSPGSYTVSASKIMHIGASYPTAVEVGTGEVSGIDIELQSIHKGDVTLDGLVDIDDATYLINFIFAGGPPPEPFDFGDADCSGGTDIDDVVWLIDYIFSGGNAPCDIDGDGVPDC